MRADLAGVLAELRAALDRETAAHRAALHAARIRAALEVVLDQAQAKQLRTDLEMLALHDEAEALRATGARVLAEYGDLQDAHAATTRELGVLRRALVDSEHLRTQQSHQLTVARLAAKEARAAATLAHQAATRTRHELDRSRRRTA